jgi:catechol 2,3-dioxygenase-like lactoylglutathione lyase family enzyme
MKSVFQTVSPYEEDEMNLPVENVDESIPFYETVMGFKVLSRSDSPHKSATLARDDVQIRLAENGGDPKQEGAFFEVDNADAAYAELKANGLKNDDPDFRIDQYGNKRYKVFFLVAPDGLCYCIGELQP